MNGSIPHSIAYGMHYVVSTVIPYGHMTIKFDNCRS